VDIRFIGLNVSVDEQPEVWQAYRDALAAFPEFHLRSGAPWPFHVKTDPARENPFQNRPTSPSWWEALGEALLAAPTITGTDESRAAAKQVEDIARWIVTHTSTGGENDETSVLFKGSGVFYARFIVADDNDVTVACSGVPPEECYVNGRNRILDLRIRFFQCTDHVVVARILSGLFFNLDPHTPIQVLRAGELLKTTMPLAAALAEHVLSFLGRRTATPIPRKR
jgi:hypothetical protein